MRREEEERNRDKVRERWMRSKRTEEKESGEKRREVRSEKRN